MNKIKVLVSCFILSYVLLISTASQAVQYKLHVLDTIPGYKYNIASEINNNGEIAGYTAPSKNSGSLAYFWDSEGGHNTGFMLNQYHSVGLNDTGSVVGGSYLWKDGIRNTLPVLVPLTISYNTFMDINNDGHIVGFSHYSYYGEYRACFWDEFGVHNLGTVDDDTSSKAFGINAHNQVIGISTDSIGAGGGFFYSNGAMTRIEGISGYGGSSPTDINNAGQVVGNCINNNYYYSGAYEKAFLWQNGHTVDLFGLNDRSTSASAINDKGQVVGYSYKYGGPYSAFIWENETMTTLEGLGGNITMAFDINDNGWIVGQAYAPDKSCYAVVWEPVPEPSSLIALFSGISTIGYMKMRRRGK